MHGLGGLLDAALFLDIWMVVRAKSACYQIWLVCQLCIFPEKKDLATVNYCKVLDAGLPYKKVWKFQLVLNAAARMLTEANRVDHIIPILQKLS